MSKFKTIDVWNKLYPEYTEFYDYAGRLIKKSACNNPNSSYFPTIDHIRPLSDGGADSLDNIVICHRVTNEEKSNRFPHWKTNGENYMAVRVKGKKNAYRIYKQ